MCAPTLPARPWLHFTRKIILYKHFSLEEFSLQFLPLMLYPRFPAHLMQMNDGSGGEENRRLKGEAASQPDSQHGKMANGRPAEAKGK